MDGSKNVGGHFGLPLLFANGYPTSLEKMSATEIQNFIPFMVQSSLDENAEYCEPEWWPQDIPFSRPLTKPKNFLGDWHVRLKEIVRTCYGFHKSSTMLHFCTYLASIDQEIWRYITNYNSTLSLYDRKSILSFAFDNKNMIKISDYDQPQRSKNCLFQLKSRSKNGSVQRQLMVETPFFDIYLCNNCDAQFYSLEAITKHEKNCTSEGVDDLNIISEIDEIMKELKSEPISSENILTNSRDKQSDFLFSNFQLRNYDSTRSICRNSAEIVSAIKIIEDKERVSLSKKKKGTAIKRVRFSRTATIPFSSLAGQLITKSNENQVTDEYVNESLKRTSKFCSHIAEESAMPLCRARYQSYAQTKCKSKKPQKYPKNIYKSVRIRNNLLKKSCRRVCVRVRKIKEAEVIQKQEQKQRGRKRDHPELKLKFQKITKIHI